jgi:hypothetical protein
VTTRKRKVALGCGGVLAVLVTLFVYAARPMLFPKRFDVVSIAQASEYQDDKRMAAAWALPVASSYQRALTFQPNGSVCGPTSLANVARSFGDAAATPHSILEGSGKCPFDVCFGGLTLDELSVIAERKLGKKVTVLRDLSLAQFREELAHVGDPARRYVLNFDRGPLFGKQGGHHSPLGAYLAADDLVLVLDVNEKYKPWLVKAERLYTAMDTVDPSSGKKRGLLRIE